MRTAILLVISAASCLAAISNFRVVGTTSTQGVIAYTAPDGGPVTIQVSTNSNYTPLAYDVDPNTFANSSVDLNRASTVTQGMQRIVVIGQRTAQLATAGSYAPSGSYAGRHFSRALQALTTYYGQLQDDLGATYSFTFQTGNIPLGGTYGDPWLADTIRPGEQSWPETIGGSAPESFVDPLTGMLLVRLGLRGTNYMAFYPGSNAPVFQTAYDQGQMPCDSAGPWSNPCGTIISGGSGNTTVGNSQAPLVMRPQMGTGLVLPFGSATRSYGNMVSMDQFAVNVTGYASSSNAAFRVLDFCLTLNGGASCASGIQQITLGNSSSTETAGQFSTSSYGTTSWLLDTYPRINVERASTNYGTDTISGNTVTWQSSNSTNYWDVTWVYGGNGRIRLSTASTSDACTIGTSTSAEYTITGQVNGTAITVSPNPPSNATYWCAVNFAVMAWRDQTPTDGSTITLTGATMSVLDSYNDGITDNGDGIECLDTPVDGGYFCMFGGMEWINTSTGANVYYGFPTATPGNSGTGNLTTNAWKYSLQSPNAEGSIINQTQSALTYYSVSVDPAGGGPLVVQCVFNPSSITLPSVPYSNGNAVGNASVSSTTAYSMTYSNGLTCTNLTPQSLNQTLVQQMAKFDPTFNATTYSTGQNGWNCGLSYVDTQGIFYFTCYAEGGDSYAWIFAFNPGNENPADAGQQGGPQIVGAVNTYNTPNGPVSSTQTAMTGRTLHALVSVGNTGWVSMNTHNTAPINTTNTSLPSSSSTLCSSFGLAGNTNQCILLNINSHTSGGVTGYEPYILNPPYSNYTGAPGELRTAQIGDTACVVGGTGSCDWYIPNHQEVLTLVLKNYQGTNGAWVFQRNGYGTETAATCSPCTLYWNSIEWVLPPGNTVQTDATTAYWNATSGCGGEPDPHGNCMMQDTNETIGHGEWEGGGGAVAANVPEWGAPIWGWPTDYQTTVGSVPGIISYPFANLTPFVTPGINYTSANPPFAGVYGHPWGFDSGSHTNAAGDNAPGNESQRAFDNSPVQGGQNEPNFTNTTGQLWIATPTSNVDNDDIFGYGSIVAINRKLMATAMSCGTHPVRDISGPSSVILSGTSGAYTGCIVRSNGECATGSTTGQIYINCPGVIPAWNTCTGSGIHGGTPLGVGNDVCVGNISTESNAVRQFSLTATDLYGAYTRTLSTATSWLRLVTGFENNRLTPDNAWILFRMEFPEYQSQEMWMGKMLPYPPADSVARGTFVPMSIAVQPPAGMSVNNAVVQFGYQEYGAPASLNCTTRNDPCLATGTTIPPGNAPFFFLSENPSGNSCASGCTITIPAISQRVLYYRIQYRSANNTVLSAGPTLAVIVP